MYNRASAETRSDDESHITRGEPGLETTGRYGWRSRTGPGNSLI